MKSTTHSPLSHFSNHGEAHMVDISDKAITRRQATASGWIHMQADTLALIRNGQHNKGDVLAVARLAAIMGSKKTAELIPLCHPLPLTHVSVDFELDTDTHGVLCMVCAHTDGKTGVEMEALTAVQIGLLTIYDMCKAVDKGMTINNVRLLRKSGGKSGTFVAENSEP